MHSSWPHLVRLHVLLHVGLLGESSAAYDALERLLACVTAAPRGGKLGSETELDKITGFVFCFVFLNKYP